MQIENDSFLIPFTWKPRDQDIWTSIRNLNELAIKTTGIRAKTWAWRTCRVFSWDPPYESIPNPYLFAVA